MIRPRGGASQAFALMMLCSLAAVAPAGATCGSAQCFLVTQTTESTLPEGKLSLDLTFQFIPQSRRLQGRDEVGEVLAPKIDFEDGTIEPDHHREIRTQNTLVQLSLAYGLTPRWTLYADVPLLNDRDHEHFDEVGEPGEFFTREDGGSGFGDVRVGARVAFLARPKNLLVGSLALEAPTGAYRLRDSEGEINEPTIQPGSGSVDALASVYFLHDWVANRTGYFVSVSGKLSGENDLDYEFGDETQAAFGVHARSGERVVWIGQVNARHASRDRFRGERVPSTGSTFVNLTPGVRLESGRGSSFYLFAAVPVFQDVNESQLAPRTAFLLGLSHAF